MSDTSVIMQDDQLLSALEEFGLNRLEARIYLHLLNKQPKSILEIAKELNIPRTSVYDTSLKLSEKGLVQKIVRYKSQQLQAYPLKILQDLIDKKRSQVDRLQANLVNLEERLRQQSLPVANTEVRYYHGKQGFQQMMWNTLSADKELVGYSQFGRVDVVGEKFARWQSEEIAKRKLKDRVITNPEEHMLIHLIDDKLKASRDKYQITRILPNSRLHISGDTTIYNNVFAVCYWQQGEIVGVEIENAELVKTQKSIFEELWKLSAPVEKYLENR